MSKKTVEGNTNKWKFRFKDSDEKRIIFQIDECAYEDCGESVCLEAANALYEAGDFQVVENYRLVKVKSAHAYAAIKSPSSFRCHDNELLHSGSDLDAVLTV